MVTATAATLIRCLWEHNRNTHTHSQAVKLMSEGKRSVRSTDIHLESVHPSVVMTTSVLGGSSGVPAPVVPIDVTMLAALGLAPGYSVVSKFGRNPTIDLNDTEDIWTVDGSRTWLSAASTLEAIGGGTDTAAGAGAQSITLQGLDANFNYYQEDLEMNAGVATAPTSKAFVRINRAFVNRVGTYGGSNTADITIRISGGGAVQTNILTGKGQTEQTHYSVAIGYTALILYVYLTVDGLKTIFGELYQRPGINDVVTPFTQGARKVWGLVGTSGGGERHFHSPVPIVGPADIWWEATSAANGTEVEAGFDLLLKSIG